jgi:hypothetical protein
VSEFEGCLWTLRKGDEEWSIGVGHYPLRKSVALYISETRPNYGVSNVLGYFRDEESAAKAIEILGRFIVSRSADARNVWDPAVPPGGFVCSVCGWPTESEPCQEHQPIAYAEVD